MQSTSNAGEHPKELLTDQANEGCSPFAYETLLRLRGGFAELALHRETMHRTVDVSARPQEIAVLRTIEAIVEPDGQVRLLEAIELRGVRRALVTILDEVADVANVTALLSESALAADWNRPEEDAAWAHLQRPR